MQTIIWAFCSMLLFLLIISFSPLGFTYKGNFFISLIGFLLALGGIAAVTSLPLWEIALMLAVLIFLLAYFMDRRVGAVIYKESHVFREELNDEFETSISHNSFELVKDDSLIDSGVSKTVLPTFIDDGSNSALSLVSVKSEFNQELDKVGEIVEEDISFLIDRNIDSEVVKHIELAPVNAYLSDIENLLAVDDLGEITVNLDNNSLEEIADMSSNNVEDSLPNNTNDKELEPLDDSIFDFLFAAEEANVGLNEIKEETKEKITVGK